MNDEGKARRAAKVAIFGKAKVMTWEDFEMAPVEHAIKQATKTEKEAKKTTKEAKEVECATLQAEEAGTGRKQCGRKQTAAIAGADSSEPRAKVMRIDDDQVKENEVMTEPWRSPVARMW